jgi:hypothetical protein
LVAPIGGVATIDHVDPFQRSISGELVVLADPTAKHCVALEHDKPLNDVYASPGGAGLATIVQLLPFQRSIRGLCDELDVPLCPMAKQVVALGHDTLANAVSVEPAGFGLAITDQVVPFQRSASVLKPALVDT